METKLIASRIGRRTAWGQVVLPVERSDVAEVRVLRICPHFRLGY
jgi:hypothetical protein